MTGTNSWRLRFKCFCRIYPKYRNANTCIVTTDAETGHLYQLSSLIRICTICNLANNIIRTTIVIIMLRLKKKINKKWHSKATIFKDLAHAASQHINKSDARCILSFGTDIYSKANKSAAGSA